MYKRVRINKSSFFRPFLIKSNNYVSKNNNKIFIHHQNIKSLEPYNKLFNDLSKNNNFQSLDFISFYEIGSKNKAKFFIDLTKYIINFLKRNFYALIKNNLYLISIQVLSNYIYYLCCINTIKRLNIKKVLVSYIDYDYENLLYKACRDLKIISICCDYSMGYPFTKNFIGRSQIDFNRNSNFVITFGALRCNQYKIYNKFNASHNKLLILTGICPQIDFARDSIKKNDIKIINQNIKENYFNKSLKISIFDNVYGCNFHINKNDIRKCIKALKYSPLEKIILCHNKKFGFFDYYLSNSGLIYKLQTKGDFSNVYYSDFIISVGFQGAALKSAFAFKKPLIFYSQNSRFFEGSNFLFEEKNNHHIIKIIEELTFNYQLLSDAISCKDEYEKFYSKIKSYSKKLLVALDLIEELESTTKLIEKILNEK